MAASPHSWDFLLLRVREAGLSTFEGNSLSRIGVPSRHLWINTRRALADVPQLP